MPGEQHVRSPLLLQELVPSLSHMDDLQVGLQKLRSIEVVTIVNNHRSIRIEPVDHITAPEVWTKNRPLSLCAEEGHGSDRHPVEIKMGVHPLPRSNAPSIDCDEERYQSCHNRPQVAAQRGVDRPHPLREASKTYPRKHRPDDQHQKNRS